MNLAIIGTGYVGLVTGACFAELGHKVICADIDNEKIEKLKRGIMPFFEPGLEEIVEKGIQANRLAFTTSTAEAVKLSEIIFLVVDTPPKPNGQADLSHVEQAAKDVAIDLNGYKLIVNMSTVPVGTVENIARIIKQNLKVKTEFDVASNPEFLREGSAVKDRLKPNRIVIGAESERAIKLLKKVYESIDAPIIVTNIRTAEMIKYASNAFLATKLSFINEIAYICELVGADVKDVVRGMGYDPRIGFDFLGAGLGYGGSCFPKDTRALDQIAISQGHNFTLLKAVIDVNNMQRVRFVQKIRNAAGGLEGKTIGILGLAFKPNTDDVREAASIDVINYLLSEGAQVKAYDPIAIEKAKQVLPQIEYCKNAYEVCKGSDVLGIVTEWDEFKNLDYARIKSLLKKPIIVDGRNILEPATIKALGFTYYGIGR
jgi:UDPglucose 6-dehydrogenase